MTALDIPARIHERLRFRFINGCQRNVIAMKIEGHEVRVMALDGAALPNPSWPRNGALVLAPGGRVDAFIDANAPPGSTCVHPAARRQGRPARSPDWSSPREPPLRDAPLPPAARLPSNGLPAQLDLRGALRVDLTLGGPRAGWVMPASFATAAAPAFRAKAGRTVVLALTNRGDMPAVFHLHGHHFRLLDRLDDGWKPFWLDTLAIDPGQNRAYRLRRRICRTLADGDDGDRLGSAAPVRWYGVD